MTFIPSVVIRTPGNQISSAARKPRLQALRLMLVASGIAQADWDNPIRIEVMSEEEIEESLLMWPGPISMLLAEAGGLVVQVRYRAPS